MIEPDGYCREIEAYLCRKNDGHLIRIVGPAFEQVTAWARDGIPVKVACAGIDRYFERYYRKGPRRRPVRVEFCEADVRDAFDDWRRAVGVHVAAAGSAQDADADAGAPRKPSLASHLERAIARLTALRSGPRPAAVLGDALEGAARALDALQPEAKRARGEARERLLEQLAAIDRDLAASALAALEPAARQALDTEARDAVAPFKDRMPADAYQKACAAALRRSVRAHFDLPPIALE
jgi:hypothetical protein